MYYSPDLLFLSNLFSSDMVLILIVALLLFGGEKLPEIARGLGKGIRDFKDASEGIKREINEQINSYEEKRVETALDKQAAQHQLAANTENPTGFPPVENTMPVNESHFTANEDSVAESQTEVHHEPATEEHVAVQHSDAGTTANELNKNLK
jgi:sec-independent protein translocase protein TatA